MVYKAIAFIKSKIEPEHVSKMLLLAGGFAAFSWAVYFSVVTMTIPYPIEFREGAAQTLTQFLLRGENPFVFENQPLGMNNYGLGYNLIVLPFAAFVGNTLFIHRGVTFMFALLSCLISVWGMYKAKNDFSAAWVCGAFIMVGLIARAGIGAFPSSTGTFFFLAAVLIPLTRSFDKTSLLISALFALIAFYTKPYFALSFGIVAAYLFLFVSKKKAAFYGVFFLFLFAVSFALIRMIFPLYFINTIAGNISNTYRSALHLWEQLTQLFLYFYPVLILFAVDFFMKEKNAPLEINVFSAWDQPVIAAKVNYFQFFFLCSFTAFISILGLHVGSYLTYAYQIALPPFFYWLFHKVDFKKNTGVVFAALVIFNLFSWEKTALAPDMLKQKDSTQWVKLYAYIQSPSNILNSPVIASKVINAGIPLLDSGQSYYFYAVQPYTDSGLLGPSYDAFYNDGIEYSASINESIKNRAFDLVFTTEGMDHFFDTNLLAEYYSLHKEIKVDMPQADQYLPVLIWKPRAK